MDVLSAVLLVIVGLACVSLLFGLVWLVRRLTGRLWLALAAGVLALAGVVGAGIATFDAGARSLDAHILARHEQIHIDDTGFSPSVLRERYLTIEVADNGTRQPLVLHVSEALFDVLREGQTVPVRYFAHGPLKLARLQAQGWTDELRTVLEMLYVPEGSLPRQRTQAVVEKLRTVHDTLALRVLSNSESMYDYERVTLRQPYDEVQLRFATEDGRQIEAVDRVDQGSGGPLVAGLRVDIEYAAATPRQARLVRGTRGYLWTNRIDYYGRALMSFALGLVVIVALLAWWRRGAARRRALRV